MTTSRQQQKRPAKVNLYLVRKDVETFFGPMNSRELQSHLNRMTVGLRDEVSGSCGPWVYLERQDLLADHYPELLPVVRNVVANGWISDSSPFRNEPTAKGNFVPRGKLENRRRWFSRVFFGGFVLLGVVAWLFSGGGELSSRIVGNDPQVMTTLKAQMTEGNEADFASTFGPLIVGVIDRVNQDPSAMEMWAPYLRAWAFWANPRSLKTGKDSVSGDLAMVAGSGEIDGVAYKKLRGQAGLAAPADCSVGAWRKRFAEAVSGIDQMDSGTSLPSDHWGHLLAWDPHWIKRRSQVGWTKPINFYQGCLLSAQRALEQISDSQVNLKTVAKVRDRLHLLNSLISGETLAPKSRKLRPNSVFGLWSCMDLSANRIELDRCLGTEWAAMMKLDYNRERFYWSMVRMAMSAWRRGDESAWQQVRPDLQSFLGGRNPSDTYTRFDYSGELSSVRASSGVLPETVKSGSETSSLLRINGQDLEINLSH